MPVIAVTLCASAILVTATSGGEIFGSNDDRTRPHPAGYGNKKVVAFAYPRQFYCTAEPTDDLDGPAHNGGGVRAAQDPDEFQHPSMGPPRSPCIVGKTANGSLPTIDPTGRPIDQVEPVWAILPFFDSSKDADTVIEAVDPSRDGADVHLPRARPAAHGASRALRDLHDASVDASRRADRRCRPPAP